MNIMLDSIEASLLLNWMKLSITHDSHIVNWPKTAIIIVTEERRSATDAMNIVVSLFYVVHAYR